MNNLMWSVVAIALTSSWLQTSNNIDAYIPIKPDKAFEIMHEFDPLGS